MASISCSVVITQFICECSLSTGKVEYAAFLIITAGCQQDDAIKLYLVLRIHYIHPCKGDG